MNTGIIEKLFSSFTDLETAIKSARKTLEQKGSISQEVLERLDSYDGILTKQRNLAKSLCDHIRVSNWDEVSRHVGLINGLSSMIRDDARAILSSLALNSDKPDTDGDVHFC